MKIFTILESNSIEIVNQLEKINSQIYSGSISKGYAEFLKSDSDFIVILKPESWIGKQNNLSSLIKKCIESLRIIEHYALSQPAIIYGELAKEHSGFVSQVKSYSYIKNIDDTFLVVKGIVARNFSFHPFIEMDKMDWVKYNNEINYYGFESIRVNSCFIEVDKKKGFEIKDFDPYDSVDLINRSYLKKYYEIGIDFSYLAPIFNGSSEYATSILGKLIEILKINQISFQIIADSAVIQKFQLEVYSDYLIDSAKCEESFYNLLFIPQQIYSVSAMEKINRICFKFVFTMLDVIALRCRYLGEPRGLDIASSIAYKYAKTVLGLSKASSKDIESFFNERSIFRNVKPVLLTKEMDFTDSSDNFEPEIIYKDYILVMGNAYKHKSIEKTLSELYDTELNLVILGDDLISPRFRKRFKVFPSGRISNRVMDSLYKNSSLILYPSLYEGFGLPVLAALQLGKKILVFDSEINRELKEEFDKNNLIFLFKSFSDLPAFIEKVLKIPSENNFNFSVSRTWKDVSSETTKILLDDLKTNLDFNQLNQRIYDVREIRKILENSHWIKLHHFNFLAKLLLEIFIRKIRWYLGTAKKFLFKLVGKR